MNSQDMIVRMIGNTLKLVAIQNGRKGFTPNEVFELIKLQGGGKGPALGIRLARLERGPDEPAWRFGARVRRSILGDIKVAINRAQLLLGERTAIRLYPRIDRNRYALLNVLRPTKDLNLQLVTNREAAAANDRRAQVLALLIEKAEARGGRATVNDVLAEVDSEVRQLEAAGAI